MRRIRPIWFVPIGLLILLGIAGLVPINRFQSPFVDYFSLLPWAPVLTIISWVLAYIVYFIGRRATQKPIKKPGSKL